VPAPPDAPSLPAIDPARVFFATPGRRSWRFAAAAIGAEGPKLGNSNFVASNGHAISACPQPIVLQLSVNEPVYGQPQANKAELLNDFRSGIFAASHPFADSYGQLRLADRRAVKALRGPR
jgi:hypothetical protein